MNRGDSFEVNINNYIFVIPKFKSFVHTYLLRNVTISLSIKCKLFGLETFLLLKVFTHNIDDTIFTLS